MTQRPWAPSVLARVEGCSNHKLAAAAVALNALVLLLGFF